jgi:uncharacterized repeat protein (TIGR03803 family)
MKITVHYLFASILVVTMASLAQAQTYTKLYQFSGTSDGDSPNGPLFNDRAGNLYSSTYAAGNLNCNAPRGCGTLFKLGTTGKLKVLHTFSGSDGEGPLGGLVADSQGNGYGTASGGGNLSCQGNPPGCGVVYKIDRNGSLAVLYSFTGPDGDSPLGWLLRDATGNLYGATVTGGTGNEGVVFEVDPSGHETVLYSFTGGPGGAYPSSSLIEDSAGNLYGTTSSGGDFGYGNVFELTPSSNGWTETVLYSFAGGPSDGNAPSTNLVRDAEGNLYGTTIWGGSSNANYCLLGCGTLFKLAPINGGWSETVLYSFTGGSDGAFPHGLVQDPTGALYGTTTGGGSGTDCCGVVFKLGTTGKMTTLHTFTGTDGANPSAILLLDLATKTIYGTTEDGGDLSCKTLSGAGCGVVFKITP